MSLLDPAVNIIIQNLKKELEATKKKMQETQEELSAWKFTPDSVTGKRLMSKCRQLLQENEDLSQHFSVAKQLFERFMKLHVTLQIDFEYVLSYFKNNQIWLNPNQTFSLLIQCIHIHP